MKKKTLGLDKGKGNWVWLTPVILQLWNCTRTDAKVRPACATARDRRKMKDCQLLPSCISFQTLTIKILKSYLPSHSSFCI